MNVLHFAQRSDEWRARRTGKATASRAVDVVARGRYGEEAKTRRDYRGQLVVENLTDVPQDPRFVSWPMIRGREKEPAALAAYSARTGLAVQRCGFVEHDELAAGCSPDGYVGAFEGIVEAKAPNTATHLAYLAARRLPPAYRPQVIHHLWITDATWCDFVSFDDRLPARLALFVHRVWRRDVALEIAAYDGLVRAFLAEVQAQVVTLSALGPAAFFRAAPLEVAQRVLTIARATVAERERQPIPEPSTSRRYAWQPALGLAGRS
jgi:hypothetical protein